MELCTQLTGMEEVGGACLLHTDAADLMIWFVTEDLVRLRVSFDKAFDEASYVLMTTAWPDRLDALFEGERRRVSPYIPAVVQTSDAVILSTPALKLEIRRAPLAVQLFAADGVKLCETLPGRSFVRDANRRVTAYGLMKEDDCFYGFGEKTGLLNKNKTFLRERATDAMGYDPMHADTLYKHIPFYIRLDRATHRAIGVFYHNFYESVFNLGCEKSNYWPRYSYFQADGGDLDCFLLGGGTLARILDQYTMLTGRPALLPKRAFGYQGSSMYYPELDSACDRAVLDFVDVVHREGFPIDGFHLSSGYTAVQNKRCVFTWNKDRFPDPRGFFMEMNKRHAQVVPNVKPGVLLCHPRYDEFAAGDIFIRDSLHDVPAVGRWWGGDGSFWDFTSPKARTAWKRCLTQSLIEAGTSSIWNDNCEYDSLPDTDCRCDYDGVGGTLAACKAYMATLMCKVGIEAVLEHDPNIRPYMVCRSGSAGIQRYAQTWCGDNATGWDTLRGNIPTITGMGLSGQPNEGGDIGGFAGPAPDEELFVRWVQQGIFQPRFSIHSASSDNTVTEPWMFHHTACLIRDAIQLRYRLTPYLYSAAYEASQNGAPILRALVYEFQDDPMVCDESFICMFGHDLLVAPVLEPGAKTRRIYLPAGCRWYDCGDDMRCYEGGQTVELPVTLASIPIFLRDGAIVALSQKPLSSMEKEPVTALRLIVAPGVARTAVLYNDDGVSNDYKRGVYHRVSVALTPGEQVSLDFSASGSYCDFVETVQVEMLSRERAPYWISLGETRLPHYLDPRRFDEADTGWYYSQTRRAVQIKYLNPRADIRLTVSFAQFDLIGM